MEPARRFPVSCCLGGRSGLGVTLDTGVGLSSSSAFNLPQWNRYFLHFVWSLSTPVCARTWPSLSPVLGAP